MNDYLVPVVVEQTARGERSFDIYSRPKLGAAGEPIGNGKYRFPCALGGSTVVDFGSTPTP